jgi:bacteriocin resistance YdeI/OmpD-like protein/uncharacterized protein DUF1905
VLVARRPVRRYRASMSVDRAGSRQFKVAVEGRPQGGIVVVVPFDPADAWGVRDLYHVHGTVGGQRFRAALVGDDGTWSVRLGPAWCRAPGFGPGDVVDVVVALEGPQSTTLGADAAAAFEAEPAAARFFDSLPSFYRKNQARWIESAKRPETRAKRIAETIELAKLGKRER